MLGGQRTEYSGPEDEGQQAVNRWRTLPTTYRPGRLVQECGAGSFPADLEGAVGGAQ